MSVCPLDWEADVVDGAVSVNFIFGMFIVGSANYRPVRTKSII